MVQIPDLQYLHRDYNPISLHLKSGLLELYMYVFDILCHKHL